MEKLHACINKSKSLGPSSERFSESNGCERTAERNCSKPPETRVNCTPLHVTFASVFTPVIELCIDILHDKLQFQVTHLFKGRIYNPSYVFKTFPLSYENIRLHFILRCHCYRLILNNCMYLL